jgi:hypothetical protein
MTKDLRKRVWQDKDIAHMNQCAALLDEVDELKATVNELKTINNRLLIENQAMTTDLKIINEQLDCFVAEMTK